MKTKLVAVLLILALCLISMTGCDFLAMLLSSKLPHTQTCVQQTEESLDKDISYMLILPDSKEELMIDEQYEGYIPYISDSLLAKAEQKISQEIAAYAEAPIYYLSVDDGCLCLCVEIIHNLSEPSEDVGCLGHEHIFFSERISEDPLGINPKKNPQPFKELKTEDVRFVTLTAYNEGYGFGIDDKYVDELVKLINDVKIYEQDDSWKGHQAVGYEFYIERDDCVIIKLVTFEGFLIINGTAYKSEYEPSKALTEFAKKRFDENDDNKPAYESDNSEYLPISVDNIEDLLFLIQSAKEGTADKHNLAKLDKLIVPNFENGEYFLNDIEVNEKQFVYRYASVGTQNQVFVTVQRSEYASYDSFEYDENSVFYESIKAAMFFAHEDTWLCVHATEALNTYDGLIAFCKARTIELP